MRQPKKAIALRVLGWLGTVVLLHILMPSRNLGVDIAFFSVPAIYLILSGLTWKIRVDGDEIHLRTLFRKDTYTFQELESLQISENVLDRKKHVKIVPKDIPGKILKQLIKVPVDCIGYEEFVVRLKEHDIPGANKHVLDI